MNTDQDRQNVGLIWIQTVSHLDVFPERIFPKVNILSHCLTTFMLGYKFLHAFVVLSDDFFQKLTFSKNSIF